MTPESRPNAVQLSLNRLTGRGNAVGFLRMVLATTVIFHHSFTLRNTEAFDPLWKVTHQLDLGTLAVGAFLVLSGFLISASFERSGGVPRYLWHRVLRLYPGFWVCLLTLGVVLTPIVWSIEHAGLSEYAMVGRGGPLSYILSNASIFIRQTDIVGVFASHSSTKFNGSLWTLPIEAVCYLVVPLISLIGGLGRRRWLLLICWLLGWAWYAHDIGIFRPFGIHIRMFSILRVGMFFASGALFYAFRDRVPLRPYLPLIGCLGLLIGFLLNVSAWMLIPTLPCIVFWLAAKLPFRDWERKADLSYGVYIYAYPIQQTLIAMWPTIDPLILFPATLGVVLPIAWSSWRFVEKPALRLKHISFRWSGPGIVSVPTNYDL